MVERPSMNLKSLLEDDSAQQEENWMLSYIDVFILMTTLFVILIVLNRSENIASAEAFEMDDVTESQMLFQESQDEALIDLTQVEERRIYEQESMSWKLSIESAIAEHNLDQVVQLNTEQDITELEIASRVLFGSAEAELSRSGESVLEKLLPVLEATDGLVYIEGHTDDRPIETKKYPSNWELASARATEVLQFFVSEGLPRERFRAVSFADTKPIAPNTSAKNRQKNRRVSLVIHRNQGRELTAAAR